MSTPVQGQGSSVEATATPSGVTTDADASTEAGVDENSDERDLVRGMLLLEPRRNNRPPNVWTVSKLNKASAKVTRGDRYCTIDATLKSKVLPEGWFILDNRLPAIHLADERIPFEKARREARDSESTSATPEGVQPSIEKEQGNA